MAEQSYFWDGLTLGDASISPYSADEFHVTVMAGLLAGQGDALHTTSFISTAGFGQTSLEVGGVVSPVAVQPGYAMVQGRLYVNTTLTGVVIPTPAANPRLDRVVLRISWAAGTIRLARLAGTEAAIPTPPALTQVTGTTFEISLAQVYVTTGGVITVRDERPGAIGLGPAVIFRDIKGRAGEEFFDHFNGSVAPWTSTLAGTGAFAVNTGVPSSFTLTSGATAASTAVAHRVATVFPNALNQWPILFEARMIPLNAAADSQTYACMRLSNTGNTEKIEFGVIGSSGTTTLWMQNTNAGNALFNTGIAIDTSGAYHTMGIWLYHQSIATVVYDGVPVASLIANIPSPATAIRAEFAVGNGTTATARALTVDWARLVRAA